MVRVSQDKGTIGMWNSGKLPAIEVISPTVRLSIPSAITSTETAMIAAREEGMALVSLGQEVDDGHSQRHRPSMVQRALPCSHQHPPRFGSSSIGPGR